LVTKSLIGLPYFSRPHPCGDDSASSQTPRSVDLSPERGRTDCPAPAFSQHFRYLGSLKSRLTKRSAAKLETPTVRTHHQAKPQPRERAGAVFCAVASKATETVRVAHARKEGWQSPSTTLENLIQQRCNIEEEKRPAEYARALREQSLRRPTACSCDSTLPGWNHLSYATCLNLPHLLHACFVVSGTTTTCYIVHHCRRKPAFDKQCWTSTSP